MEQALEGPAQRAGDDLGMNGSAGGPDPPNRPPSGGRGSARANHRAERDKAKGVQGPPRKAAGEQGVRWESTGSAAFTARVLRSKPL